MCSLGLRIRKGAEYDKKCRRPVKDAGIKFFVALERGPKRVRDLLRLKVGVSGGDWLQCVGSDFRIKL